jgi:hypothetical protein
MPLVNRAKKSSNNLSECLQPNAIIGNLRPARCLPCGAATNIDLSGIPMLLAPSELDTIRVPYQQGLRTWVGQVSGGNRTRFGAAGQYCVAWAAKEKQERSGKVTSPFFMMDGPSFAKVGACKCLAQGTRCAP